MQVNLIGPMNVGKNLKKEAYTIFVDGGKNHDDGHYKDSTSCGDGDSCSLALDIKLPKEKDRSDLFHALQYIPKSTTVIEVHGFYGGRIDHFLCNLGEFHNYLKENTSIVKIYDKDYLSIIFYPAGTFEFSHQGLFSLFCFEKASVNLTGPCKYPLLTECAALIPLSSHGLSNEGQGLLRLATNAPLMIIF